MKHLLFGIIFFISTSSFMCSGYLYQDVINLNLTSPLTNVETYDAAIEAVEAEELAAKNGSEGEYFWMRDLCYLARQPVERKLKCITTYAKPMKVFFKLLKKIMPAGASATDEEITAAAREFAKSVKEISFETYHELFYGPRGYKWTGLKWFEGRGITRENVDHLKEGFSVHPVKNASQIFDVMYETRDRFYCDDSEKWYPANRQSNSDKRANCKEPTSTSWWKDYFWKITLSVNDLHEIARSEESVVDIAKHFTALIRALKQSASYESAESFSNAISTSNLLVSAFRLLRKALSCFREHAHQLSETTNAAVDDLVSSAKSLMTGDKEVLDHELLITKLYEREFPKWFHSQIRWDTYEKGEELTSFLACALPDLDRKLYMVIAISNITVVDETRLRRIKQESDVAYDILYLLNWHITTQTRKDGLSEQAAAFYKKVFTVPFKMRQLAEEAVYYGVDSADAIELKRVESKNTLLKELNDLPVEVRMELVERFPVEAYLFATNDIPL